MPQLQRHLGLFDATMLVVGSMVGSGVFISLAIMARQVQTPGILLGLWIFGGLFTLLGALCCAELAASFPHSGGQYAYLREAYNDFWAFLFGWTQFLIIQSGFNAAVAIAFAKYLGSFLPWIGENNTTPKLVALLGTMLPRDAVNHLPNMVVNLQLNSAQLVACAVIALLTAVNIFGVRGGARVQNIFTVLKIAAIIALTVAGLTRLRSLEHFLPVCKLVPGPDALHVGVMAGLAVALSKALFAYDAWYTVAFVAEEVHDSPRTLPKALLYGTLGTMGLYVLVNAAYLAVLPVETIGALEENRVGAAVAAQLFGPTGTTLVIVAILISTFGCVNGLILGGARVLYAMAREGLFFKSCARLDVRGTPVMALIYQGVWSIVLTLTGSYNDLLTYTTFASVAFGGLTAAAVYVLRWKEPDRPRPYRCWGYPFTPALYLAICIPFLFYVILGAPKTTGIGVALVLSGVPFYGVWKWKRSTVHG